MTLCTLYLVGETSATGELNGEVCIAARGQIAGYVLKERTPATHLINLLLFYRGGRQTYYLASY